MVLGKSLRQVGVKHDLVLVHTPDMPPAAIQLVASSGWRTLQAEELLGVRELYGHGEPRFKSVFTKLQVLGLKEYDKVLLLDIDTLVLENMDDLFALPAPAAMARGPKHCYHHGDPIEGQYFFGGASYTRSWGQRSGINAGVMLMEPNENELRQMIEEVLDTQHPSHIKGNGPEQDYLSRYWADCWTHIGVENNFQLHQLFYALHPDHVHCAERVQFLGDNPGAGIRLVHYSGPLKPWSRFLEQQWAGDGGPDGDAQFLKATLESFPGYWLWCLRDRATWDDYGAKENFVLDSQGRLRRIDWQAYYANRSWQQQQAPGGEDKGSSSSSAYSDHWTCGECNTTNWKSADRCRKCDAAAPKNGNSAYPLGEVEEIPEATLRGAERLVEKSLLQWHQTYKALSAELGCSSGVGPASLACQVQAACVPPPLKQQWPRDENGDNSDAGWKNRNGWWTDFPVMPRVSVLAGTVPDRHLTLSANSSSVLDLCGEAACGVHAIATASDGQGLGIEALGPGSDAKAWAESLPDGAFILLAMVDAPEQAAKAVLAGLTAAGCGAPQELPPASCRVLAAVGKKGTATWNQTMAAADFALATLPISL